MIPEAALVGVIALLLLGAAILHFYFRRAASKLEAKGKAMLASNDLKLAVLDEKLGELHQQLREAQSMDALASSAHELVARNIELGRSMKRLEAQLDDCLDRLSEKKR